VPYGRCRRRKIISQSGDRPQKPRQHDLFHTEACADGREDSAAPLTTGVILAITIDLAALGNGTFTIHDDGTPGNATSVVRDPAGNIVATFAHPADALTILSRPGQSLDVNFTESLSTANFTVGSLTDAAVRPDDIQIGGVSTSGAVTLAANGAITEFGGDAAPDITAGSVVFSAGSGVGTGANAIETRTGLLEAETTTGGITLSNTGALTIGGLTSEVAGLDVASSGNLKLTNVGSIVLADETGTQTIHGANTAGNVTLIARGAYSDITSSVNQDAISAAGGSVALTAGRDVAFGTAGLDYDNDVRARDNLTITAGRDVRVDGFADLASDGFGTGSGGDVEVNAGGDIRVQNTTGTDGSIGAEGAAGGNTTLNAGPDGFVILLATSQATLFSSSGDVTVHADHMVVAASAGITANTGSVTLLPATEGWAVDLGSGSDSAFALELSDAELNRIFSPTLNVGGASAGDLRVLAALTPANVQNLALESATDITIGAALTVSQMLSLVAGDNLFQTGGTMTAAVLSAQVDNLGNDGNLGGFGGFGGVGPGTITLSGNAQADTLRGAEDVAQTVRGRAGNDTIYSSGEGSYFGDAGDDLIFAGLTGIVAEMLDGGAGIDTLDTTSYDGDYEVDMVTGATNWGETFVNFEKIITGDGRDHVTGTDGDNSLQTRAGDDTLAGGGGDDSLVGGGGADLLEGGAGQDTLRGGSHQDVFRFRDGDLGATRPLADLVADFNQAAGERIHLAAIDANTNVASNQAFIWIGNGAFTGAARQLHYVQQGGKTFIEGDTNGDGAADFAIALTGTINLVAADIVL
jgi:Ca2+-binding RTX toxin-like protein